MNLPMDLGFESHPHDARRMVRRDGKDTEVAAAARTQLRMNEKRQAVLEAVHELGGAATAEQAERLPQFATWGPSSVRKRLTDLKDMGHLIEDGTRLNSRSLPMTLYRVRNATPEPAVPAAARSAHDSAAASQKAAVSESTQEAPAAVALQRGPFEVGERVRIRENGRMAEVYEIARDTWFEPAFRQRIRCGYSIMKDGTTLAGVDQWYDGDEVERLP